MKKRITALSIILVGLVASLVGFGVVANLSLDRTWEHYQGVIGAEARHINGFSVHKGYVSQETAYQTNDGVINVWHEYARLFGVEPTGGMGAEGRCVQLTKTDEKVVFRSQVTVRLCPIPHGTQVFFNQVLYLWW